MEQDLSTRNGMSRTVPIREGEDPPQSLTYGKMFSNSDPDLPKLSSVYASRGRKNPNS